MQIDGVIDRDSGASPKAPPTSPVSSVSLEYSFESEPNTPQAFSYSLPPSPSGAKPERTTVYEGGPDSPEWIAQDVHFEELRAQYQALHGDESEWGDDSDVTRSDMTDDSTIDPEQEEGEQAEDNLALQLQVIHDQLGPNALAHDNLEEDLERHHLEDMNLVNIGVANIVNIGANIDSLITSLNANIVINFDANNPPANDVPAIGSVPNPNPGPAI